MKYAREADYENHRAKKVLLIIVLVVLFSVAIGIGVYGLFFMPNQTPTTPTPTPLPKPTATVTPAPSVPTSPTNPEGFTRWAASALFDWDTATMNPSEVTDKLMAVADPTGEGGGAGLANDIGNYLPYQATWVKLRGYATKQRIEIETVVIPEAWEQAKAEAAPGQILPGTVAYTITGTRFREGVWEKESASYVGSVEFTIFVTCAPSFPECHLMRLSRPDEPLK
ncbi:MAG: hypothetical protein FWG11_06665 [Promicromonosporaceae bacterium]|nr:hypothetical protein [Promicromonosporaceae bacterium]